MHVAVGSTNPVKRAATERALDGRATVKLVGVDSGVPEQPRGRAETVAGAETHAERARAETDAAVGVGLEGGVAEVAGTEGLYLVMWGAATDGDRWGRGGGPSVQLPESVAARVRDGAELGPVMDDYQGREGVAEGQGAAGVFTTGPVDRTSALAHAAAGALAPLVD